MNVKTKARWRRTEWSRCSQISPHLFVIITETRIRTWYSHVFASIKMQHYLRRWRETESHKKSYKHKYFPHTGSGASCPPFKMTFHRRNYSHTVTTACKFVNGARQQKLNGAWNIGKDSSNLCCSLLMTLLDTKLSDHFLFEVCYSWSIVCSRFKLPVHQIFLRLGKPSDNCPHSKMSDRVFYPLPCPQLRFCKDYEFCSVTFYQNWTRFPSTHPPTMQFFPIMLLTFCLWRSRDCLQSFLSQVLLVLIYWLSHATAKTERLVIISNTFDIVIWSKTAEVTTLH